MLELARSRQHFQFAQVSFFVDHRVERHNVVDVQPFRPVRKRRLRVQHNPGWNDIDSVLWRRSGFAGRKRAPARRHFGFCRRGRGFHKSAASPAADCCQWRRRNFGNFRDIRIANLRDFFDLGGSRLLRDNGLRHL